MGKGILKHGGKSGILPKVRPVFKRFPIRPKTEAELAKDSNIVQGYSEGVPLPQRKGFTFHRTPPQTPVLSVEERIKRNIEDRKPEAVDESKLSSSEIWLLKRDEIRRNYLREAYLVEAERLKKVDEYKLKVAAKEEEYAKSHIYEESVADTLTLPTIDSYLQGPIMRNRTPEEEILIQEQRLINRKTKELGVKEDKANLLLDLYHSAAKFITTEEELELAIKKEFDSHPDSYGRSHSAISAQLLSAGNGLVHVVRNEALISDKILGELNGKPGLENINDNLSGEGEKLKREAKVVVGERREY